MTTYTKIDGTLTNAKAISRLSLGAPGAIFAYAPQGIMDLEEGLYWQEEYSRNLYKAGTTSTAFDDGIRVDGGGATGGIPIPANLVSDNFTFLAVLNTASGTRYLGDIGQYKLATTSGYGGMFWIERNGVSRIISPNGQTKPQAIVVRCQGASSRIISGGSTQQDHTINATARAPYTTQFIGTMAGINDWFAFALWNRPLTNTEMDEVLAQNLINFPKTWR